MLRVPIYLPVSIFRLDLRQFIDSEHLPHIKEIRHGKSAVCTLLVCVLFWWAASWSLFRSLKYVFFS